MTEISGFTTDTTPTAAKYLLELDTADHTMASTGTDKKVTIASVGKVVTGWADLVRDYGADPTGATSVATPLANACSAAVSAQPATVGLTVPPGKFLMTAPQDLPWNLVVRGAGGIGGDVTNTFVGSVFNLSSSFSGSSGYVFGFKDLTTHVNTLGSLVSGIFLDGSAYTALAVDGFSITGPTMCTFENLTIAQMSGWAVSTHEDTSAAEIGPFGQTWTNVTADSCGNVSGGGFQLIWCEDSVFTGCYSIGNNHGPGFYIQDCDNAKFTACNSEFNSTYGFYVTGDWQFATGGCQFTGCSTDGNGQYGMLVDATWTTGGGAGTGPGIIMVTGAHFRRDGQVTSTNSAGLALGATTLPVIVSGFSTMPSIGDSGGGSMNPAYGLYFTQSSYAQPVVFSGGLAWGLTGAIQHGAGGGGSAGSGFPTGVTSSAIALAHGNNYAPTYGS